ncbi:hypothetical protein BT69DRAFT_956072 [Atractiella rhizophila]|nr:hypothetical protein BT69DRAFT_956072 [Atractiella rhizophila]
MQSPISAGPLRWNNRGMDYFDRYWVKREEEQDRMAGIRYMDLQKQNGEVRKGGMVSWLNLVRFGYRVGPTRVKPNPKVGTKAWQRLLVRPRGRPISSRSFFGQAELGRGGGENRKLLTFMGMKYTITSTSFWRYSCLELRGGLRRVRGKEE